MGHSGSVDYSYRTLNLFHKPDSTTLDLFERKSNHERGKILFSHGIDLGFRFKEHFSFRTGAYFSLKGYGSNDPTNVDIEDEFIDEIAEVKNSSLFYYLDVPLIVGYQFKLFKGLSLKPEAGVILNYYGQTRTKEIVVLKDGTRGGWIDLLVEQDARRWTPQAYMGFRFKQNFGSNNRWSFDFGPEAKFSPISRVPGVMKERLYSLGFNLGITYRIGIYSNKE